MEEKTEAGIRMLRLFAVSWGLILSMTGYLLANGRGQWFWPLVGVVFCAAGLLRPQLMRGPYRIVERGFRPAGHLVSMLIMAVVFFGMFTPYAFILRLTGWNPLRLKRKSWGGSAWIGRTKASGSPDYRWQY